MGSGLLHVASTLLAAKDLQGDGRLKMCFSFVPLFVFGLKAVTDYTLFSTANTINKQSVPSQHHSFSCMISCSRRYGFASMSGSCLASQEATMPHP